MQSDLVAEIIKKRKVRQTYKRGIKAEIEVKSKVAAEKEGRRDMGVSREF